MSQKLPNMLESTISKIREMVNANTVVGEPITTADGVTMIHWYFGVSAAGALHIKNFACYDGVVIPTKE